MSFLYQTTHRYFAQAAGSMEDLCAEELLALGASEAEPVYRGVSFVADARALYDITYRSRFLTRILAPLEECPAESARALYQAANRLPWESLFSLHQTFAITASGTNRALTNSLYAAQCLKDAIVDRFRETRHGKRPSVQVQEPDVRFNLRVDGERAVLSLDVSGESLHRRGYRLLAGEAPMQETLAAAIIHYSEWDGTRPLWDPMCGSGTLLCEALMAGARIPAQYLRSRFGFMHLPDFDAGLWKSVRARADAEIRELPPQLIQGSDRSRRVLESARENLSRIPGGETVSLACRPFQHSRGFSDGVIVANPPYGIRLGEYEEAWELYTEFGDFLKQRCTGSTAFIYTGDPSLRKAIGLRTSRRIPLVNGKLEGVLLRIDLYEGSKKARHRPPDTDAESGGE